MMNIDVARTLANDHQQELLRLGRRGRWFRRTRRTRFVPEAEQELAK